MKQVDVAIIGAGILGLAHAYLAASAGQSVAVFDRSPQARGASVRNFGMIWPIGQPPGPLFELALESRAHWMQILHAAKLPYRETGSFHLAYADDEAAVTQEFAAMAPGLGYTTCQWLDAPTVLAKSEAVVPENLRGGLWSGTEATVDPRQILATLPTYLAEQHAVQFHWARPVRAITSTPSGSLQIETATGTLEAGAAIVCSGEDFETLYPDHFATSGLTRCKLQMMRTAPQPAAWQLGPSLAAGLTLRFYKTFALCPSLPALAARIAQQTPEFDRWLIHALVSQTVDGAITLGDSHEYNLAVDIFNKQEIDDLILTYTKTFLRLPTYQIAERWYGVYAKHLDKTYVVMHPQERVRIVGSPGGSGMTLSFGVAAESIREMGLA
jgi:FAD dependent oxidoreductase TIGR03364